MNGHSQAHMGEAERLWSKASCDSRTPAIWDCRLDPRAGARSVSWRGTSPVRHPHGWGLI